MTFQGDKYAQKLCDFCMEMFSVLPAGFYQDEYYEKNLSYHKSLESFQDSVEKECAFCVSNLWILKAPINIELPEGMQIIVHGDRLRLEVAKFMWGNAFQLKTSEEYEGKWKERGVWCYAYWRIALPNELRTGDCQFPSSKSFSTATLQNCLRSHTKCGVDNSFWHPTRLVSTLQKRLRRQTKFGTEKSLWHPTRLIEITWNGSSPSLRLIDGGDVRKGSAYVALSHCWGNTPISKLTTKNINEMKVSIGNETLPKTFQDAILVAFWLEG